MYSLSLYEILVISLLFLFGHCMRVILFDFFRFRFFELFLFNHLSHRSLLVINDHCSCCCLVGLEYVCVFFSLRLLLALVLYLRAMFCFLGIIFTREVVGSYTHTHSQTNLFFFSLLISLSCVYTSIHAHNTYANVCTFGGCRSIYRRLSSSSFFFIF